MHVSMHMCICAYIHKHTLYISLTNNIEGDNIDILFIIHYIYREIILDWKIK